MSDSSSTTLKTSRNGVQGLAMMLPVLGIPLGIHVLGGALFVGAGIAVAVAPLAVPVALPLLYNVASKGGFDSITRKLFPSAQSTGAVQRVVINKVADDPGKGAEPVTSTVIQASV
jgi:hypothetical protein